MPPTVPRKRLRSPSPSNDKDTRPAKKTKPTTSPSSAAARKSKTNTKPTNKSKGKTPSRNLKKKAQEIADSEDTSSALSSLSDNEFEDVAVAKAGSGKTADQAENDDDDEDGDEDEEMEFEDVPSHPTQEQADPVPSGDLSITLYQNDQVVSLTSSLGKKGPSKRQKKIRNATHCMHVMFLMWHNSVRNGWLCDQEVQATMISHLPPRLWDETDRWRRSSGLDIPEAEEGAGKKSKGCNGKATKEKGKGKQKAKSRDWSEAADRLENGVPDLSRGDPLFRLMKTLSSWWKQRFRITAPGLRKWGYMDPRRLAKRTDGFHDDPYNAAKYGERITSLDLFRHLARECVGSRDVGAQLFVALLRGLGLEARLVANLQTLGFGWSKAEEADDEKPDDVQPGGVGEADTSTTKKTKRKKPVRPKRRRPKKNDPDALHMDLDDSDEYAELEDSEDEQDEEDENSDDVSTTQPGKPFKPARKQFDKDLEYPHYWAEVLSPVTHKYLPVDPIVKSVVGSNRDLIESLEPRGAKADKAKQSLAYVVGFSQDATAKDLTVRYLRKQLFPGRTKGVRTSVEKVPVYNKHGKVKRYEQYDFFRTVMRGYTRGTASQPVTEIDHLEDSTDLTPAVPEKKEIKEGEETLQYYKSSADYVLARHLKREEALPSSAAPVKSFHNKLKGGKIEAEPVYSRKDVVPVKSAETWHKQGRAPLAGAVPLKHAPYRAATTNRRRELAEAEARTGGKVLQPLYGYDQTEWIIPPPIEDGVIPKNSYGNIDMFAEHMCPEGAVHLPYRSAAKACKVLGDVDFAEAVVGFEFGHRMAVPVIQGVVVAVEQAERVAEEIERVEAERERKENEKKRREVLGMWKKLVLGLRVRSRIQRDYGDKEEGVGQAGKDGVEQETRGDAEEEMGGGFLPEGYEEEEEDEDKPGNTTSGYFATTHEDDEDEHDQDGGFVIEDSAKPSEAREETQDSERAGKAGRSDENGEEDENEDEEEDKQPEPIRTTRSGKKIALASRPRSQPKPKPKAKPKPRPKPKPKPRSSKRGRKKVESSEEEEDDNSDDDDDDDDFEMSG